MKDENKTKAQLREELRMMRRRISELEGSEKEYKSAEKALNESEEQYRLLVDNANDAIFVTQDQVVIFANPKTERMTGYRAEELARIRFADLVHPKDRDLYMEMNRERRMPEDSWAGRSFRMISRSNEELWVQPNIVPITWEGRPAHLNFLRDITPQKQVEAQLQQAQKMEAVGTLAGGVAHDFNNLLTTIVGNADLALMDVSQENPLRRDLEEIRKAGEKAASLTRQLLAFSRRQVVQPKLLDLNEVLAGIEKMLRRLIGEDIELETALQSDLWAVEVDPGQMEHIIINLAVNARDAMPHGGKLTIETANTELVAEFFRRHSVEKQPGRYVMVAVGDTGGGMDPETQARIFEPFFTTKERGMGTGLGLSTVYGIVKQNRGYVWVYSIPGQGSVFKVYLPRVARNGEARKKAPPTIDEIGGYETVMIVEDDYSLREVVRRALERYGYKVLEAENGEGALKADEAYGDPIQVLVTDVVMPGMGGKAIAERFQILHPAIKVLYMSGYADRAIVHHGILDGDLEFIQKPFTPEALVRKVRQMLDE